MVGWCCQGDSQDCREYSPLVLGARKNDRAAASAARIAYKSLPRVWVARDASIYYYDNLITRLSSLPLRFIPSIIDRASALTPTLKS